MTSEELEKKYAPSVASAIKNLDKTFTILRKADDGTPAKSVYNKIREIDDLTEWEKMILAKSGNIRWESILAFYTVDCVKAGFMKKNKGIWYATDEGVAAHKKGPIEFFNLAREAYNRWDKNREKTDGKSAADEPEKNLEQKQRAKLDDLQAEAAEGIAEFISSMNPYEFQELVGALLRAMGYHTPFIAPRGRDGGIDLIAYPDPLGASTPKIKVQVKHMPNSAISVGEIRSLMGILNKEGEMGLFVTSGRFTNDSIMTARTSPIHIKLLDFSELIDLWQEFYDKMTDEEKNLLPLHPIYFLGEN